ncbi:hypothetical protein BH10PSE13_BH10PSE13_25050 [soil metagenome]
MGKHKAIAEEGPPPCEADARIDDMILALIAAELDDVRGAMEEVAAQLCADIRIVQQHGELLQSIDELAQRHENLARVMRCRPMEGAIDAITLESLRNRMLDGVTDQLARSDGQNFWTTF